MNMTTNEETPANEVLVADDIRRDEKEPRRLVGEFHVAGHPARVVLDFTREDIGLVEYVEMSSLIGMHAPSQRAVLDLMYRVYDGEAVQFPFDLTEEVRHSSPPFPFVPMSEEARAALEIEAGRVRLDLIDVVRDASEPSRLTAKLLLEGAPLELEVELYAGPGRVPLMRWLRGPDPASLSAAERHAILHALLNWLEGARGE